MVVCVTNDLQGGERAPHSGEFSNARGWSRKWGMCCLQESVRGVKGAVATATEENNGKQLSQEGACELEKCAAYL